MRARYFFSGLITLVAFFFFLAQFSSSSGPTDLSTGVAEESPSPEPSYPAWMTTIVEAKESIPSSDVFTFDCETIDRKPTTLTTTCADFGIAIFDIKWKAWGATGAFGVGTYSVNKCQPSCAEGKRVETPVSVQLQDLLFDGNKYFLNRASITPLDPKQDLLTAQDWDLGEFYRDMWAYENQ